MTTAHFDFILTSTQETRANMRRIMESFTLGQLNEIPPPFRNNLLWNYGHVLVTQQLLCYGLAGLPLAFSPELVAAYRKGSTPTGQVEQAELAELLAAEDQLLLQFKTDHQAGRFREYKTYTTSFGVTITGVEEAFQFNLAHEAMHLGTMLAIRKLL